MNLKAAAQRLGVHYQTAYKWVRSGALVAVRVGSGYEISEAALERFVARREALGRVRGPADIDASEVGRVQDAREARAEVLADLDRMVARVTIDARAVLETIVRRTAYVLGDSVVIRLVSDDGRWIESVAFHNADPERYVLLGTILRAAVQRVDQGFAASVLATGEVLHMPHVRQDRARAIVLPEYHQFLDEVGVHSLLAVPISDVGSTVPTSQAAIAPGVIGVLYASRDTPGRPYGDDDKSFLVEMAERAGIALRSARECAEGWRVRSTAKDRIEAALADGGTVDAGGDEPAVELEDLLADLLSESDLGLALHDVAGRWAVVSERFTEMVGGESGAQEGSPYGVPHGDSACGGCLERLVSGEIDFVECDRTVTRRDGRDVHVVMHRSIARAPDATPHCVVDVVREEVEMGPGTTVMCRNGGEGRGPSAEIPRILTVELA